MAATEPKAGTAHASLPVAPMHHNNEVGGSTMPPQKKMPMLRSAVVKPTDDAVRLELNTRLKALEAAVRHSQEVPEERQKADEPVKRDLGRVPQRERWPPRDDAKVLTLSSAEIEAEGKKPRTNTIGFPDPVHNVVVYTGLDRGADSWPRNDKWLDNGQHHAHRLLEKDR